MIIGQPEEAYEEFARKYEVDIRFSLDQVDLFERGGRVVLSNEQMHDLVNQIASQQGMANFLENSATDIQPISLSLYVLNDALWKMMERKPWDESKMLAMTTIPYCFWDQKEESTSNPKAVKRWELEHSMILFKPSPPTISIAGDGGDFCGFLEQSMITSRKFGLPETRKLIPNYQFTHIEIDANLSKVDTLIHPRPMPDLDYDFSAPAKQFHDHGIHLTMPGEDVILKVEKRKPARLNGEVHMLMAAAIGAGQSSYAELLADVWFWMLRKLPEVVD